MRSEDERSIEVDCAEMVKSLKDSKTFPFDQCDGAPTKPVNCIKCGGRVDPNPLSHPDNKTIWAWQYCCCDQIVTVSRSGTPIESCPL